VHRFIICLFGFLLPAFTAPGIYDGGVVNGADYTRICGPGMIFSIFGTGFSTGVTQAPGAPLPKVLDGVSVDVLDGQKTLAAPLFFVAPGQINAQMPFEVSGATVEVRVKNAQGQSGTQSISITPRCPRLFTKLLNGKGEPIVVHGADNSLVSTAWPARGNEIVVMYLTGLGATKPAATTGGAGGDGGGVGPLNLVGDPVTVKVGDQPAVVHWAGLAPYFVGLYQLNFQIPATLASGMQPVTVSAGGQTSQAEVALAVRAGQPLTTVTVGAGGGNVEAGGITLNVPAGAFPSPSSIALNKAAPGGDLPASTASGTYLVEGLPAEWNAPIEVAIELTRAPESGKSVFVVVQIGMESAAIAKPFYLPARVEGNRALAIIPAASPGAAAAASKAGASREAAGQLRQATGKAWMSLRVQSGYEVGTCSAGSSFQVWVDTDEGISKDVLCALQEGLDDAKTKLETIAGLNWKARTDWPLKVWIRPFFRLAWESTLPSIMDRETYGLEGRMPLWGARVQDMELNSNLLSTPAQVAEMKRTGAHELFHVLQNLYDPRSNYAIASGPNNWLWFMEAASTWFERAYWGQSDFIPETTKRDYYFLTIRGLEVPPANLAQAIVQAHGYGAAMFLEYLSKTKGTKVVGDILSRYPKFPNSSIDAIKDVVGDIGTVWRAFCGQYMAGTIYPVTYPTVDDIIAIPDRSWLKVVMDASLKEMKWDAPDLSAIVYRVQLNKQWSAKTNLNVRLTDPGGGGNVQVYAFRNSPRGYSLLGGSRTSVLIENADTLAQSNTVLYVMVSNGRAVSPYTGTTPITVAFQTQAFMSEIRKANYVYAGIEALPICSIDKKYSNIITCPRFLTSENLITIKTSGYKPFEPTGWQQEFSVSDSASTATNTESFAVSFKFSESGDTVTGTVERRWGYRSSSGFLESVMKLTITGLPHTWPDTPNPPKSYHTFQVIGADAAKYVTYSWTATVDGTPAGSVTGIDWTRSLLADKNARRETGTPGVRVFLDNFPP